MAIELSDLQFGPLGPLSVRLPLAGITIVLGPNGAGKSLLLRLLDGLEQPQAGTITSPLSEGAQAHLFHEPSLLNRSVIANLVWALKLAGKQNSAALAQRALQQIGIADLAQRPALQLSQGEKQLVALARAVALAPKLLLLDEPTSNLAPPARQAVETNLQVLRDQGMALILTSHDMRQAKRLADRILFLDQGQLVTFTDADSFFANPGNDATAQFLAEGL